jgi:hypothetical protein
MATDADIVPQAVTDFVFDLYDSVTLSQLTDEQSRLYNTVFRDLSSKVSTTLTDFDIESLSICMACGSLVSFSDVFSVPVSCHVSSCSF